MTAGKRVYRAGLVGCGYWGPNLLRNLRAHPRIELVRVADKDPERRAFLAKVHPPVPIAADAAEVFGDPSVDIAVVATEASTHARLVEQALRAGKHVLVEKPLALSRTDAARLGALARTQDRLLLVGHTFLYDPAVIRLAELIATGELGELRYVVSQRLNLGKVRADIGVIWNLGPHDVSILEFLVPAQPVVAVRAQGSCFLQPGIEDLAFLHLELAQGAVAHVHLSWLDPCKVRRMTVVGSRKMVVYDDTSEAKLAIHDRGIDRADLSPHMGDFRSFGEFHLLQRAGDVYLPKLPAIEPLAAEIAHLVDCLDGTAVPRSDARHGERVVAVLEAALASVRAGGERIVIA